MRSCALPRAATTAFASVRRRIAKASKTPRATPAIKRQKQCEYLNYNDDRKIPAPPVSLTEPFFFPDSRAGCTDATTHAAATFAPIAVALARSYHRTYLRVYLFTFILRRPETRVCPLTTSQRAAGKCGKCRARFRRLSPVLQLLRCINLQVT